jgi:hypothetical protein
MGRLSDVMACSTSGALLISPYLNLDGLADRMLDYSNGLPLTAEEMIAQSHLFDPEGWTVDPLDT